MFEKLRQQSATAALICQLRSWGAFQGGMLTGMGVPKSHGGPRARLSVRLQEARANRDRARQSLVLLAAGLYEERRLRRPLLHLVGRAKLARADLPIRAEETGYFDSRGALREGLRA